MRKRSTLTIGTELLLTGGDDGYQYHYIVDDVESEEGASCICYKVHKKDEPGYSYLLKEFYPEASDESYRDENQEIHLAQTTEIREAYTRYVGAINAMRKFQKNKQYSIFIGSEKDVQVLHGNGTVYCINVDYYDKVIWKDHEDESLYDILTCAISIARFISYLHEHGIAYIDLKPGNILLKRDGTNNIDYANPVFFDFDSVLPFDTYKIGQIHGTRR